MAMTGGDLWALILAGGDGTRLQALTRLLTGAPIPKQYCRILGGQSLLEATLARVGRVVSPERTLAIVNQPHLEIARAQLTALPLRNVLVQPCNRETGPGIAMPLLALARRDPAARVAVFPSDHFVRGHVAFTASLERMQAVLGAEPEKIVLLGVRPDRPDPGLGYIVPGRAAPSADRAGAASVRGFEEKPTPARAAAIMRDGALWSSFIMVFRVSRMLTLLRAVRPREMDAIERVVDRPETIAAAYRELHRWNFSDDVLARCPQELLVVPADDLSWSDWGTPESVAQTFSTLGLAPPWLSAAAVAAQIPTG